MKITQVQIPTLKDQTGAVDLLENIMELQVPADVDLVTLPEMFCCPYETSKFSKYAEPEGGYMWKRCSKLAAKYNCYLSAGTMPELAEDGSIYNTAYIFDRSGRQVAKHRKMHLFDIDVEGGQRFKESDTLSAGNEVTIFDSEFGRIGLCICYDFRFPELSRIMALHGARLIIVPAAFNMTTGPMHWELMFRSQAMFNQVYAVGTAPARDEKASYKSWGHSIIVDPWGRTISQLGAEPAVTTKEIDLSSVREVRNQIPLLKHRRTDIYSLEY